MKQRFLHSYWSLLLVAVVTPLLLMAAIPILPTHDDWVGTTSPSFDPFFVPRRFLFYGYHWRPFDTMVGYLAGLNPQLLFPALNHCLVVLGHAVNALLVYRVATTLGYSRQGANLATAFFLITPATMATVLAVDSQNQTYALMWGMTALLLYIRPVRAKYVIWPLTIMLAAWSKENGLMWALICPLLAYGYRRISLKVLRRDLLIGLLIMAVYALAIVVLPKEMEIHPEYVPTPLKIVGSGVKFLFTTFITVDYVYLLHQPHRHLPLAALSLALALPWMYMVYVRRPHMFMQRRMAAVLASLLIAAAPHVFTVFSMMHTYGGLIFVALIVAEAADGYADNSRPLHRAFALFAVAALAINAHLCRESYLSGLVGKQMAVEAIAKTATPARRVTVVIIEDDYPKLSSFCVIPNEAFGWGLAAKYETGYAWPEAVEDTTIERTADAQAQAARIAAQKLASRQADCVWIIDRQDVRVVNK